MSFNQVSGCTNKYSGLDAIWLVSSPGKRATKPSRMAYSGSQACSIQTKEEPNDLKFSLVK